MGIYIVQFKHTSYEGSEFSNDVKVSALTTALATDFADLGLAVFQGAMFTYCTAFKWRVSPVPSDRSSFVEGDLAGPGSRTVPGGNKSSTWLTAQCILVTGAGDNGAKYLRDAITDNEVVWEGETGTITNASGGEDNIDSFGAELMAAAATATVTIVIGKANRPATSALTGVASYRSAEKRWHNRVTI